MIESKPRSPVSEWVSRRVSCGKPLTSAACARTVAAICAASAAMGADGPSGRVGRRCRPAHATVVRERGEHGVLLAEEGDQLVHGGILP